MNAQARAATINAGLRAGDSIQLHSAKVAEADGSVNAANAIVAEARAKLDLWRGAAEFTAASLCHVEAIASNRSAMPAIMAMIEICASNGHLGDVYIAASRARCNAVDAHKLLIDAVIVAQRAHGEPDEPVEQSKVQLQPMSLLSSVHPVRRGLPTRNAHWRGWGVVAKHGCKAMTVRKGDRVRYVVACSSHETREAAARQADLHAIAADAGVAVPMLKLWLDNDVKGSVTRLLGVSESELAPIVVMEMPVGTQLAIDKLNDAEFDKASVAMIECVHRLHKAGVIHSDVKTQNFVWWNGEVRLTGFEAAQHGSVTHDLLALGQSLREAKQASDAKYVHHAALSKLIEHLCAPVVMKRWSARRALKFWRTSLQAQQKQVQELVQPVAQLHSCAESSTSASASDHMAVENFAN